MGKNKIIVEDSNKINYPRRISVIVEDSIRKTDVEDQRALIAILQGSARANR
jgi:hypothetical protein